jgi:para-nitrobenzyl esterase
MQTTAAAQAAGVKMMQALGVSSLAELRARPLADLALPAARTSAVDGYLIPEDYPRRSRPADRTSVDVLTGSNADEANFGICPGAG